MATRIGKRLAVAGSTDIGKVRTHNEDAFSIDSQANLMMVADGMGGHDAGEVASAGVIETISRYLREQSGDIALEEMALDDTDDDLTIAELDTINALDDQPTLDDLPNPVFSMLVRAVARANTRVNGENQTKGYANGTGMGSTIVGLWLPDYSDHPAIFHVGDSRLYQFRKGALRQITRDHSMYQQWVDFGGKGSAPAQNVLLQAMGPNPKVTPDIQFLEVQRGDVLMLCSDGLSGMVTDEGIIKILAKVKEENIDASCKQLIELANKGGGKDNITVVLGYVYR